MKHCKMNTWISRTRWISREKNTKGLHFYLRISSKICSQQLLISFSLKKTIDSIWKRCNKQQLTFIEGKHQLSNLTSKTRFKSPQSSWSSSNLTLAQIIYLLLHRSSRALLLVPNKLKSKAYYSSLMIHQLEQTEVERLKRLTRSLTTSTFKPRRTLMLALNCPVSSFHFHLFSD